MNNFIKGFCWIAMLCMGVATVLEPDPIRAISFSTLHLGLVIIMLTVMVKDI
jgi:hypothetical protein